MHHGWVRTLASYIGDDRGETAVGQLAARATNLWGLRARTRRTMISYIPSYRSVFPGGYGIACVRTASSQSGNKRRPIERLDGEPTGKEADEPKRHAVAATTQTEDTALARGPSSVSVTFLRARYDSQKLSTVHGAW
ncbi:uncharacterized protein LOC112552760 [Pogonomyrmex barbatus]|uniref:Uncharacterized protein LOC112552760 n=1 Tax=Pogonomyrmex barbatus TaxID=144034 RepID=A0A8N1S6X4_9HYME|nr:uncharacterized protein LOC112552760 [Pogonomyrmex barbatus]